MSEEPNTDYKRAVDIGMKIIKLMMAESDRESLPSNVALSALVVATTGAFKLLGVDDIRKAAECFAGDIVRCARLSAGPEN